MKLILILSLIMTSCATFKQSKRDQVLDCTKDLIEYDALPTEAYLVCRDLHAPKRPAPVMGE